VSADDPVTTPAACDPVLVTGYVDGALDPSARLSIEAHLADCERCREQVEAERALANAVRALPHPPLPHGLAARVRRRSRKPETLRRRVWIPSLAATLLVVLLGRSSAPFVAWEVALDHAHCFGKRQVPAQVFTDDPMRLSAWFEAQETDLPFIPGSVGELDLVGGRFCRLIDRTVAHVYYGGGEHQLSLYVIPGTVRFDRRVVTDTHGATVALLRVGGANVAVVSTDGPSVAAFRRALERTIADGGAPVTTSPALW